MKYESARVLMDACTRYDNFISLLVFKLSKKQSTVQTHKQ